MRIQLKTGMCFALWSLLPALGDLWIMGDIFGTAVEAEREKQMMQEVIPHEHTQITRGASRMSGLNAPREWGWSSSSCSS